MSDPVPVVIDTDVGADPDDAFALAFAAASPEIVLRGVTVVDGDVDLRARMAARLLGMTGRTEIPVFLGARRPLGPGRGPTMLGTEGQGLLDLPYDGPEATIQTTMASDWLIEQSRRAPFHLVAIGPLTNVATALRQDPGFGDRLSGLTVMGGVFDTTALPAAWRRTIAEGGPAAWPDHNTASDPTAALICAEALRPITWVTFEATLRVPLRRASLDRLPDGYPLTAALRGMAELWGEQWFRRKLPPADGQGDDLPGDALGFLHDPLTVAALFPNHWLGLRRTRLAYRMEDGLFRLHADGDGRPAVVSVAVDGPGFGEYCLGRIAEALARLGDEGSWRRPTPRRGA